MLRSRPGCTGVTGKGCISRDSPLFRCGTIGAQGRGTQGAPMPLVRFSCPRCGAILQVSGDQQGQVFPCPGCQQPVRVPGGNGPSVWYHSADGQQRGPFTWDQLRQLAARGFLRPTDLLRRQGDESWRAAGSFPGLFPEGRPDEAATVGDAVRAESSPPEGEGAGPLPLRGLRPGALHSITLGDFQILHKLGAGGMGAVYLARQRSRDRSVALKVLARHLACRPAYVRRFYREAGILASLDHPGLVRIVGLGDEQDFRYFAMDYVDGHNIDVVRQRLGGRMRVPDALFVVLRCAEALRYAHDQHRIIHRDVKPSNILLDTLGQVKLSDLGLAKAVDEDLSLTESGTVVGTPDYMAPEQMRNAKHADHRSDLYALGSVLYRLVTGHLPFRAEGLGDLLLAKEDGIFLPARRLNPEVPPRLSLILDKMLARDLRHRYESYADLIRDLESLGLANPQLGFNLLQVMSPPEVPPPGGRVEILLIHDDAVHVLLAQEALDESGIPSNLNVVGRTGEALAFLGRQGKYAAAARPNIILLDRAVLDPEGVQAIASLKEQEAYRDIPLVVLTTSTDAAEVLRAHGLGVRLKINKVSDLSGLDKLLGGSDGGSTITLVELRPC